MKATLIRGGLVVSLDPAVGQLAKDDVLIEGDVIKAVGAAIDVDTVLVAGQVPKRGGQLVYPGLAQRKEALFLSGQRILGELGLL